MQNRVTVFIGGRRYVLLTEESEEYTLKIASLVNEKIEEQKETFRVSETDAAVMAALVLADELCKAKEATSNALNQIQEYVEDASKARAEVAELKRELSRLRGQLRQD